MPRRPNRAAQPLIIACIRIHLSWRLPFDTIFFFQNSFFNTPKHMAETHLTSKGAVFQFRIGFPVCCINYGLYLRVLFYGIA